MAVSPKVNVDVSTPKSMAKPPGKRIAALTSQKLTAMTKNTSTMAVRPIILPVGVRPSERFCTTLVTSSNRPRAPVASIAPTARKSSVVGLAMIRQVRHTAKRMMTPPMVGVPAFTRCDCGPSARIC